MIARLAALPLAFLLLSVPAAARTVTVRSGDHADFSRLLLKSDFGLDWKFGRVEGGYEFRPAREDIDWNLRGVFDRISHDRVADLHDLGGGRMFIHVTCPCHGDAFVLRDGQVVIDIKDGAVPGGPFEARLPAPDASGSAANRTAEPATSPAGPDKMPDRAGLPVTLPQPAAPEMLPVLEPRFPGMDPWLENVATVPEPAQDSAGASAVQAANLSESELLEQIAKAAAQGLLDADLSRLEDDIAGITPPPVLPTEPEEKPVFPPQSLAPASHISVESAVDRALPEPASEVGTTENGLQCISSEFFDVASWGSDPASGSDLGSLRTALLDELDRPVPSAVTALVRYYVFLSFGAEAEALLRRYPDGVERPGLLMAMAQIMDRGSAENAEALEPQMACDSPAALWATLAQPALVRGQPIDTAALTLAFAALPVHLRTHLGPDLARKFIDIGDTATASLLQSAIARGTERDAPALGLLSAQLELADGAPARAARELETIIQRDSPELPEALLARVEAALQANKAVAPDEIALLESVAFEHMHQEDVTRLQVAIIRARAADGDFAGAFADLEAPKFGKAPVGEDAAKLTEVLFHQLATDASDADFLRFALPRLDTASDFTPALRRALAGRFLDLGFTSQARHILDGGGALPEADDRILFARAALAENRPEVAVGYLAGLHGEEAERMRATALESAGDFAGAVRIFTQIGDQPGVVQAAWRGGLWDRVTGSDAGAKAAAAAMMRAPQAGASGEGAAADTPLARSQGLVETSRAAREVLSGLLSDVSAPTPAAKIGP